MKLQVENEHFNNKECLWFESIPQKSLQEAFAKEGSNVAWQVPAKSSLAAMADIPSSM